MIKYFIYVNKVCLQITPEQSELVEGILIDIHSYFRQDSWIINIGYYQRGYSSSE